MFILGIYHAIRLSVNIIAYLFVCVGRKKLRARASGNGLLSLSSRNAKAVKKAQGAEKHYFFLILLFPFLIKEKKKCPPGMRA